ncbi:S8 family serine peptidase [Streptomyces litchfieldiae]|uniref:S8 family serine peptidase n=1 Tax=Streptomyces litchfieldiae TaxID=3075543 RepID=A0ABU2MP41_9ACTN|nr:S8 family serine peptidase [Streptomyces sp. DSM 44938]MDT0343398.1 S8 family serine peptidase [Streptomyces sp. DSM 44938]
MRKIRKSPWATAVVAAAALTTGLAAPATARDDASAGPEARGAERTPVSLITGDMVVLGQGGQVASVIAAEGRESVPTRTATIGGAVHVFPVDTLPLIADGTLDRDLFNVSELSRPQYRAADGLPLIVTYEEDRPRALSATPTGTPLEAINGEALTVDRSEAADVWASLTEPASGERTLAAAPGIATIALDGLVEKALADSVPGIGAPEVWDAGHDGTGTTIAVLDTGIDADHPDLAGQVIAERNFSDAADAEDRDGHGTHVASTAAGNGEAPGVAPGAGLLNGKVLDDDGYGWDSGIIEGMQWAVEQGADVVNLSLGGSESDEIDPLEEAVNTLSAESDTLFVIAAGNNGPGRGTLDSPGTADAALTLGAVDKSDALADFSSTGPRRRDGAVKPDVTAPGVDITAATPGGGHATLSGTSMATPHAAGAAALLAQAHPDWTGEQIKAALIASARPSADNTPYQQGTGRIDVPAASEQTVIAESGSLAFGTAAWPHEDDEPLTEDLTYTNLGDTDVTLELSVATGTGPDGGPAPDGMFTLGATEVTVPAGGTATVPVTADTRPGGDVHGGYAAVVTAFADWGHLPGPQGPGGGETVRTAAGVEREAQMANLTVGATDRAGAPTEDWYTFAYDLETLDIYFLAPGQETARLPVGDYWLDTTIETWGETGETPAAADWLVQPGLSLTEDTTVTFDAADAEPITMTMPDGAGEQTSLSVSADLTDEDGGGLSISFGGDFPDGLGTAQVGGTRPGWQITGAAATTWEREGAQYHSAHVQEGAFYTGLTHHTAADELARVTTYAGSSVPGATGHLYAFPDVPVGAAASVIELPRRTQVYLATDVAWIQELVQVADDGEWVTDYWTGFRTFEAGRSYERRLNVGVFGPNLDEWHGVFRSENLIYGGTSPFTDGAGNYSYSAYDSATTTLYRDGQEYASVDVMLDEAEFEVPADEAEYELVSTVTRGAPVATVSTEVTTSYTFTSAAAGAQEVQLPASAVRFGPNLTMASTSPAGRSVIVPITVQGSAAGGNHDSLTVSVSFDGGETWTRTPITDYRIRVTNPAAGGTVSFRAEITDAEGNTSTQTIIDAYRTA